MSYWIMSANPSFYDHGGAIQKYGYIYWKQTRRFAIGDIVFLYCTKPYSKIMFMTRVEDIDIGEPKEGLEFWKKKAPSSNNARYMRLALISAVDDDCLSFSELSLHGLVYPPQGPMHLDDDLVNYICRCFRSRNEHEKAN